MVRRWTKEQEDFLVATYTEKSIDEIVETLPYTRDAIYKKAQRMKLRKPDVTKEQIAFNAQQCFYHPFLPSLHLLPQPFPVIWQRRAPPSILPCPKWIPQWRCFKSCIFPPNVNPSLTKCRV